MATGHINLVSSPENYLQDDTLANQLIRRGFQRSDGCCSALSVSLILKLAR